MTTPSPEELRGQYSRAVEEYRFQVDLNWRRLEYFFVLNIGVLIAAATMLASKDVPRELVAVLFFVGALLAALSFLANDVQSGYYRAARQLKQSLEEQLALGELALATTPGMGSPIRRLGRVGTFLKIMLVAVAVADLVGAGFALHAAFGTSRPGVQAPEVMVRLSRPIRGDEHRSAIVVSRDGEPVVSRRLPSDDPGPLLQLAPGRYLVSVAGGSICQDQIQVSHQPLQLTVVHC